MTDTYELPEPAAWKFRRFLEHRESLEWDRPSEHDGEVTALYTADQVRLAVKAERERAIAVVQDEIDRAQTLLAIEECGSPLFDRAMTEAGICALRTVMHVFQASADAAIRKG